MPVITLRRARDGTPPVSRSPVPQSSVVAGTFSGGRLVVPAGHVTTGGDFSLRPETVPRMISA